MALSIDHPSRVRVSIEGDVALAFPATLPDATPEDDIRGIGAALYALLVNRWPLPESGVRSGLEPADLDAAGEPVEPRSVDRDIPFQISAAAARAVQEGGGIRSAPTLLNLLQQATAVADRTELIAPVDEAEAPAKPARVRGPAPDEPEVGRPQAQGPDRRPRRRRRRHRRRADRAGIGAARASSATSAASRRTSSASTRPTSEADSGGSGATIKPVQATVFSPEGEADAPDQAPLAIDGNSSTVWPTDTYSDPVPFPNFKNGVGLMLQLPQPTAVGRGHHQPQQHRHLGPDPLGADARHRRRWTTPPC